MNGEKQNNRIIYFYDALCGWCYGFSPVITRLYDEYKSQCAFEAVSGGMIVGERIGLIGKVAPYISQAYKTVEQATGVRFGEEFLNNILASGTANFSSLKPAIALSVFKESLPERSIEFASTLCTAVYFDGIEPDVNKSYGRYAETFGFDVKEFVAKMDDSKYFTLAEADFAETKRFGVDGFPAVVLQKNEQFYLIARGYTNFENLKRQILAEV